MKKIYALVPLVFMTFLSTSVLAGSGICTLHLVKEDGNFEPSDYGPNGRSTYNITMPYTDGFYPNRWTSSQPKPRLPLSNCIAYQDVPSNAKIESVRIEYTFQDAKLVADYSMLLQFLGPQKYAIFAKRGGGATRTVEGIKTLNEVDGRLLSEVDLELRSQVTNPQVTNTCGKYISTDQCNTGNTRLSDFTAQIYWSN
jgi:hypothetical protein